MLTGSGRSVFLAALAAGALLVAVVGDPRPVQATVTVASDLTAAYDACVAKFESAHLGANLGNLQLSKYGFSVVSTTSKSGTEPSSPTNASNGVGSGATISWNPTDTSTLRGEDFGQDPCATLYHEIAHARQDNQGSLDKNICWYRDSSSGVWINTNIPIAEVQATRAENQYRASQQPQLPQRSVYFSLIMNQAEQLPPLDVTCQHAPGPSPAPTAPSQNCSGVDGGCNGRSYGDPHIVTLNAYAYEFQAAGEFVLSRSTDGAFQAQMRSQPVPGQTNLTLNTAVALGLGGHRLVLYAQAKPDGDPHPLRLDGKPVDPADRSVSRLPDGSSLSFSGGDYFVQATTGERVTLHPATMGTFAFINVNLSIPPARSGLYVGILGDGSGNQQHDLRTRSGQSIALADDYANLAGALGLTSALPAAGGAFHAYVDRTFADSWRLAPSESLFDYAPGTSTASFTDRSYPRGDFAVATSALPGALRTCANAGVAKQVLAGCVVDVSATGSSAFAEAVAHVQSLVNVELPSPSDVLRTLIPSLPLHLPKIPSLPGL
jgi:hypothetical protein